MSSQTLFAQLASMRDQAGISRFRAARCVDLSAAESGRPVSVSSLCRYARLVGAEVRLVRSSDGDDLASLKAQIAKLSGSLEDSRARLGQSEKAALGLREEIVGMKGLLGPKTSAVKKGAKKPAKSTPKTPKKPQKKGYK